MDHTCSASNRTRAGWLIGAAAKSPTHTAIRRDADGHAWLYSHDTKGLVVETDTPDPDPAAEGDQMLAVHDVKEIEEYSDWVPAEEDEGAMLQ